MVLQPVGRYSGFDEIVYHRFSTPLGEVDVVFLGAYAVGMRSHLDGDIGIVAQQRSQSVEGFLGFGAQSGTVEIVENILDNIGLGKRCQHKVHTIFSIDFSCIGRKFLTCIEVAFGSCQHGVAYATLQMECICTVGTCGCALIRAVVAYDAYHGIGYRFLIVVSDPTVDYDVEFRQLE